MTRPNPNPNRLTLFVGVLAAAAVGLTLVSRAIEISPIALAPIYMFSPMVAGLVVCLTRGIPLSDVGLRIGRARCLAASAVVALPLVGVTLPLAVAVPGVGFDPTVDPLPGVALPAGLPGVAVTFGLVLALGTTVNALFAFGEEFGWRGYLLWELAPLGFWKASVGIGALWGIWHAPVIVAGYNYPSFPTVGVVAMTVACVSFSPVYTYVVVRAESAIAAALVHGVFNGAAGFVVAYAATDDAVLGELVASPVGLAGVVAFGLAAVAIALSGTPTLSRSFSSGEPVGRG
ncbi:CPBP family intramembrane glutamic endopeptidase [Natronomonas salsuginis]|uniref:CPBP family intramembrane metalloprotease n=1 Tax=Natronomonas salsuginis TaxID=2217661 RepID=A0A4U5JFP5_9EURY|nr:CPBP family intramembrane glutamic endopeptidase [Natronomonas salsuginis]TKR27585.1 CPBP family intramembrane metalloprotease [Natronomonas salsuginis]